MRFSLIYRVFSIFSLTEAQLRCKYLMFCCVVAFIFVVFTILASACLARMVVGIYILVCLQSRVPTFHLLFFIVGR
jgi:hypothetical protein